MTKPNLLAQKAVFEEFLARTTYQLSSFSFVNIFTWKDFFDFEFKVIHDTLCVFASNSLGVFLYLPPLGENITKETIDACFDIMFKRNKGRGVSRIENVEEHDLALFSKKDYVLYKKSEEFVYCREDIALLRGNKYKSKRSSYNQFVRSGNHEFRPWEPNMQKACMDLYSAWANKRKADHADDLYRTMIDESRKAHEASLRYFKELGLVGRVVLMDKKLLAYTFGFPLTKDVFCVLHEIADLDIKGLPTYIFKEFCADIEVRPFKFINVMDDFGLENIRKCPLNPVSNTRRMSCQERCKSGSIQNERICGF
ncbi:MAG: phosphatidylglycerol lysyltransferase domain-containing protein [Candidatus Omnitrophica bacterium]|nr:phosphatidylglycerol lysyltransferase domain-containing protein [Candidatus Omnitrophota bacterium]